MDGTRPQSARFRVAPRATGHRRYPRPTSGSRNYPRNWRTIARRAPRAKPPVCTVKGSRHLRGTRSVRQRAAAAHRAIYGRRVGVASSFCGEAVTREAMGYARQITALICPALFLKLPHAPQRGGAAHTGIVVDGIGGRQVKRDRPDELWLAAARAGEDGLARSPSDPP